MADMSDRTRKNSTTHLRNSLKQSVGRGAQGNITSRFVKSQIIADLENYGWRDDELDNSLLRTELFPEKSKTLVTSNDSPDLGFDYSANPYRGCEHGCIYCYARPTHEYLNLSAGLDFESKIFVKYEAAALLREKLQSRAWKGETILFSGVTDCYQPIERKLRLTRSCMEVLHEFCNPVVVITKNQLIRRDIDIFSDMARYKGVMIYISITSLNPALLQVLEPRTSTPSLRLKSIEDLARAGVPVGVNVAPIIPGLTDHELPGILKAAAEAGAKWAGYVPVRLPLSVAPLFSEWLDVHAPEKKNKVLNSIRSIREGKLNDAEFGSRMTGKGVLAEGLADIFALFTKKYKLNTEKLQLSSEFYHKPDSSGQLAFDLTNKKD